MLPLWADVPLVFLKKCSQFGSAVCPAIYKNIYMSEELYYMENNKKKQGYLEKIKKNLDVS